MLKNRDSCVYADTGVSLAVIPVFVLVGAGLRLRRPYDDNNLSARIVFREIIFELAEGAAHGGVIDFGYFTRHGCGPVGTAYLGQLAECLDQTQWRLVDNRGAG